MMIIFIQKLTLTMKLWKIFILKAMKMVGMFV